jgi:hypothetical protein
MRTSAVSMFLRQAFFPFLDDFAILCNSVIPSALLSFPSVRCMGTPSHSSSRAVRATVTSNIACSCWPA